MTALTKDSIPADLRNTYDYLIDVGKLSIIEDKNSIRLLLRKSTLGEAVELLSKERPGLKAIIRMPVPRHPPWKELATLIIESRSQDKIALFLGPTEVANLSMLLSVCGHGTNGVQPFTLVRGPWLDQIASQIELYGKPETAVPPDFFYDEVEADVARWVEGLVTQDRCPLCDSTDVVVQSGLRGCNACKKTTKAVV